MCFPDSRPDSAGLSAGGNECNERVSALKGTASLLGCAGRYLGMILFPALGLLRDQTPAAGQSCRGVRNGALFKLLTNAGFKLTLPVKNAAYLEFGHLDHGQGQQKLHLGIEMQVELPMHRSFF